MVPFFFSKEHLILACTTVYLRTLRVEIQGQLALYIIHAFLGGCGFVCGFAFLLWVAKDACARFSFVQLLVIKTIFKRPVMRFFSLVCSKEIF